MPKELNDFVILDPYWLVEGIKGIVTIKEAKKLKKDYPMSATNTQWREFLGNGVLTSQLGELITSVYWKGNEEWKSNFMNSKPPVEVYKLSFGPVKRREWVFHSHSTRYSILLKKGFELEQDALIGISCDSGGMRQELSISILEQHTKSSLFKVVMDDILSESTHLP